MHRPGAHRSGTFESRAGYLRASHQLLGPRCLVERVLITEGIDGHRPMTKIGYSLDERARRIADDASVRGTTISEYLRCSQGSDAEVDMFVQVDSQFFRASHDIVPRNSRCKVKRLHLLPHT